MWNGVDTWPQEYAGKSFSNNIGHLDRDRFFDNPDKAFRVVHLGSSHVVASQVRPCDRYNLLMEEELGMRLGRPVEVISLGRNNGDVAANFPRVADFAVRFEPDVILLESGSFLMMQLQPELLHRMHGYDPAHTHLSTFYYDERGVFTFRPSAEDWMLHVDKPNRAELVPGVPFDDTLRVPAANLHPLAVDAFKYLAEVMRQYRKEFPKNRFMLNTGLDQAQDHGKFGRTTTLHDGAKIPIGAEVFLENMKAFCAKESIECLNPAIPKGFNETPDTYLTFVNDIHYSPRGHQWLARELSRELLEIIGQPSAVQRKRLD